MPLVGADAPYCHAAELPVRVPPGFGVTLYTDDDLATDVTAMTVDHEGNVVVAGPGYIKTLHDDDGDGRADRAPMFAEGPPGGAQGLVVMHDDAGPALVAAGNGLWIYRYEETRPKSVVPVKHVVELAGGERGCHGVCQGPDGDLYFAYGSNDSSHVLGKTAVGGIQLFAARGGAILRSSLKPTDAFGNTTPSLEVLAYGFDNPYDLDFHSSGRLFTADGDDAALVGTPWYVPAGLYDVAWLRDHGRTVGSDPNGLANVFHRPKYYYDAVSPAADLGRAAPTGLVVYKHRKFPAAYRGGVFSACWMFGRVDFLPLKQAGSTYTATKQTFLEVTGDAGFAPVDLAIGPEGDLFVACGGRGTRGAVWRVRYVGDEQTAKPEASDAASKLRAVLQADQPQAAWSRARWIPEAKALGKEAFVAAIADAALPVEEQVRAVEILVELFDPITLDEARTAVALKRPELSARIAWLVERQRAESGLLKAKWPDVLAELTFDDDPRVQLSAWENLGHVPATMPRLSPTTPNWIGLMKPDCDRRLYDFAVQYHGALARPPDFGASASLDDAKLREAYDAFQTREGSVFELFYEQADAPEEQLRQLRRVQLAFGGWAVNKVKQREVGYRRGGSANASVVQRSIHAAFPTGRREVDHELARTMLMFPSLPLEFLTKLLTQCTAESSVTDDLHYLCCVAVVTQQRNETQSAMTARALLRLPGKFARLQIPMSPKLAEILGDLLVELSLRDVVLYETLAKSEEFGDPRQALFVKYLPQDRRDVASRRMIERVLRNRDEHIEWTPDLIELFTSAKRPDATAQLRELWSVPSLRDAVTPALLQERAAGDRAKFVDRLASADPLVVQAAAVPLRRGGKDQDVEAELSASIRGLRQMCTIPEAVAARRELVTLVELWGNETFQIQEPKQSTIMADPAALRAAYQPVFLWYSLRNYDQASTAAAPAGIAARDWRKLLLRVDWDEGDVERGRTLFAKKLCVRCHTGNSRLGPNLDDAVARYGRTELFATVFEPSRFVPPRYRPTTVEFADGRTYTGIPIAEASDIMLLQTAADATVRLRVSQQQARYTTTQSIMPLGMLNDATPQELADLYAYLKSLRSELQSAAQK
jgi:putative heme-binding domain-containing protein